MEALMYETERRTNYAGVVVGMAACALSGGFIGFMIGVAVGAWF